MGLLSPYNVEGKWSSAGAGDQGHTRDGNLATEQLLRLGQSSTGIRLDARLSGMLQGPTGIECTDEKRRHGREQSHLHIQGHRHKNNDRNILLRSIGTPKSAVNYDR
jgi:hypothetical protein